MAQKLKARVIVRNRTLVVAAPPLTPGDYTTVSTRNAVETASINSSFDYLRTSGFGTVGDGGDGQYKFAASEPSHAGKVKSLNNRWYELAKQGWPNVQQFGVKGDGANESSKWQDAINYLANNTAGRGGPLLIPYGDFQIDDGITITSPTRLVGAGRNSTILRCSNDVTVVSLGGSGSSMEHLSVYGKGTNSDTGTFGANNHCVVFSSAGGYLAHCSISGGASGLHHTGADNELFDIDVGTSYATNCTITGTGWYNHCKFDHAPNTVALTDGLPFSARANTTAYTVGQVRSSGGFLLLCRTAGISGGAPPTLRNYGLPITDGTVTWELLAPVNYGGISILTGAGENRFTHCDTTGAGYQYALTMDSNNAYVNYTDGVFAAPVSLLRGNRFTATNCDMGDLSVDAGWTGNIVLHGNTNIGPGNWQVGGSVNIVGNDLDSGTITINSTADDFVVADNTRGIIVDNSSAAAVKTIRRVGQIPAFRVHKNATDQTGIADSTFTLLTWPFEQYDVGGYFTSNGWTPPAGKVRLDCSVDFSGTMAAGALTAIAIYKNGTAFKQKTNYTSVANGGSASVGVEDMANGSDVYTARIYIDVTSGTATVSGGSSTTDFYGHWISP